MKKLLVVIAALCGLTSTAGCVGQAKGAEGSAWHKVPDSYEFEHGSLYWIDPEPGVRCYMHGRGLSCVRVSHGTSGEE